MYVLFSECSEVGEMMFPLLSRKIRAVVKYLKKKKKSRFANLWNVNYFQIPFSNCKTLRKIF